MTSSAPISKPAQNKSHQRIDLGRYAIYGHVIGEGNQAQREIRG